MKRFCSSVTIFLVLASFAAAQPAAQKDAQDKDAKKADRKGKLQVGDPAPAFTLRAMTGKTTVSLSQPIARTKPTNTPQPRPVNQGGALTNLFLINGDYLFERQEIEYHGGTLSHFDALCHVSYNGKLYNGFNFKEVVTTDGGCSRLTVNTAQDGIVTRGVLLDIPGTRVMRSDVDA